MRQRRWRWPRWWLPCRAVGNEKFKLIVLFCGHILVTYFLKGTMRADIKRMPRRAGLLLCCAAAYRSLLHLAKRKKFLFHRRIDNFHSLKIIFSCLYSTLWFFCNLFLLNQQLRSFIIIFSGNTARAHIHRLTVKMIMVKVVAPHRMTSSIFFLILFIILYFFCEWQRCERIIHRLAQLIICDYTLLTQRCWFKRGQTHMWQINMHRISFGR